MKAKHSVLIALIINLIIRIPRMLYAQGLDGFLAIWEAKLILNGDYFSNGFNIFSLLGLTPYSGYPIGSLLILCFFLLIAGKNVMISILLFDLFFTILFVLCTYFLSAELEMKHPTNLFFILIMTTLPNILTFSSYTSSVRYPFFAILPLVLALFLKFNKEKKIIYLMLAVFMSVILNFFHRMALVLFGVMIISVLFFIIEKITGKNNLLNFHNKKLDVGMSEIQNENSPLRLKTRNYFIAFLNYFKQRFWIFSIIGLFVIGFLLFGANIESVIYTSKFNIYCYLKPIVDNESLYLLIQPIVDQWFYYGVPFILFLISILIMFIPKFDRLLSVINNKPANLFLIFYILPFVFVYQSIYSYYFLCYIVALVSAILIQLLRNKRYRHYLYSIGGLIVGIFITLYHFIVTEVLPYLIIGLFLIGISSFTLILLMVQRTRKWLSNKIGDIFSKTNLFAVFTFGIIILNSIFIVDRHSIFTSSDQLVSPHITKEERDIAEFLSQNGIGTFDSFDNALSTHVAALCDWYYIQDIHNLGVFLIEERNIENLSCHIAPISSLFSLSFFNCSNTNGRRVFHQLITKPCYTIDAFIILKKYNLRYFISARNSNTSLIWESRVDSIFIQSLYIYVPIVMTTENYYVWNTTTLYS